MAGPEQPAQDPSLTDKLEELESLLEQQDPDEIPPEEREQGGIPVLDELVTAEDYVEAGDLTAGRATEPMEDIDDLARKLGEKLSMELDQVMHVLKGNLKNSIIEELRTELDRHTDSAHEHGLPENDNEHRK